jgi:hypothetical protein
MAPQWVIDSVSQNSARRIQSQVPSLLSLCPLELVPAERHLATTIHTHTLSLSCFLNLVNYDILTQLVWLLR